MAPTGDTQCCPLRPQQQGERRRPRAHGDLPEPSDDHTLQGNLGFYRRTQGVGIIGGQRHGGRGSQGTDNLADARELRREPRAKGGRGEEGPRRQEASARQSSQAREMGSFHAGQATQSPGEEMKPPGETCCRTGKCVDCTARGRRRRESAQGVGWGGVTGLLAAARVQNLCRQVKTETRPSSSSRPQSRPERASVRHSVFKTGRKRNIYVPVRVYVCINKTPSG